MAPPHRVRQAQTGMTRECFKCLRQVPYAVDKCPACGSAMGAVEYFRKFWNEVAHEKREANGISPTAAPVSVCQEERQ